MNQDSPKNIVVIGAGFAGLWSAIGAARKLERLGIGPDRIAVNLVNRDSWHGIRVRYYESDLSQVRVPLNSVLSAVGVGLIEGVVTGIDPDGLSVTVETEQGQRAVSYDRLILAAGSQLYLPDIPGLDQYGFSIDTYNDAKRLDTHLRSLAGQPPSEDRRTVLVIGGGLTGIELACELPGRLKELDIEGGRIILADRLPHIGSDMGLHARPVIDKALSNLGIETRTSIDVTGVDANGVTLADGSRIAARTVIWCAGMVPNPLAAMIPATRDSGGRLVVDRYLKVTGVDNIYAAGDIAAATLDGEHLSVMSCQHARPMGRFAGHNAVAELCGESPLALQIPWYSTCLDLGPAGAVRTEGWDRTVVATGTAAKAIKQTINCTRIYPPESGTRAELMAAAEPVLQAPPGEVAPQNAG